MVKRVNADLGTRLSLVMMAAAVGLGLTLVAATAQGQPDFDASGKEGPTYARPGDVITYTILVENEGDTAHSVVLSDELPSGVSLVPGSCHYQIGGTSLSPRCPSLDQLWPDLGPFHAGTRITASFAVTVTTDTLHHPLVNRAHLQWDGGRMTMPVTTTVLPQIPDFAASEKSAEPEAAATGDVITYTITAANAGDPVTGVVLSDLLPHGVAFISDSCTYRASFGEEMGERSCAAPPELWHLEEPFTSGGTVTTTFQVTVTDAVTTDRLVNRATLSWDLIKEEMAATTTLKTKMYLPLVLHHYPPLPHGTSVTISNGAKTVHQRAVTLTLDASFPPGVDEVTSMRFSSDGKTWGDWMPYTTTTPYTLTSGVSALNEVHVAFRGSKGGVSTAADGVYLMLNGDFETGAFDPWQHGGELNQFVTTTHRHSGTYAALLGDPRYANESVPVGSAWARQTINVPSTGDPRLSVWYRIFSYDVMWSDTYQSFYDYFDIYVESQDGTVSDRVFRDGYQGPWEADTRQDLGWQRWTYDLSDYEGETIRIRFASFNTPGNSDDPGLNTYTFVDDVSLEGNW
jgi:uncharacterized repeat protein (TIGR01451 family)